MTDVRSQTTGFEDRRHAAYPDPITKGEPWTIGIGHTGADIDPVTLKFTDARITPTTVWSDAQIDAAFELDLAGADGECVLHFSPWYTALNDPRKSAMINMVFQMGISRVLGFVHFLGAMRDERYEDACGQLLDSKWAKETPHRALTLARQIASGEWQT